MTSRFDRVFRKVAISLIAAMAKVKFSAVKQVKDMPTDGSLILCNHTSIWDFGYLIYSMFPCSHQRFLATAVHFDKSRFIRTVFTHLGMIRKNQGSRDLQSVKDMLKASREGGIVVIYPAGMTSFDGRPAWEPLPGIGSMPKLIKSDVYAAVAHGGFISYPRYAHRCFRGRVEVELKRLYTTEEAASLKPDELQAGIAKALYFNDWDWQEAKRVPFKHMKDMRNVSRTLYMCPACKCEGEMREGKGSLTCKKCGFSAKRDKYGFFSSSDPTCPARMDRWVDLETEKLKEELQRDDFALTQEATFFLRPQNSVEEFEDLGKGVLTLTKRGLSFKGEKQSVELGLSDFQFLMLSDTDRLIVNTDQYNYRFVFTDVRLMTKWFFAHRLMAGIDIK